MDFCTGMPRKSVCWSSWSCTSLSCRSRLAPDQCLPALTVQSTDAYCVLQKFLPPTRVTFKRDAASPSRSTQEENSFMSSEPAFLTPDTGECIPTSCVQHYHPGSASSIFQRNIYFLCETGACPTPDKIVVRSCLTHTIYPCSLCHIHI